MTVEQPAGVLQRCGFLTQLWFPHTAVVSSHSMAKLAMLLFVTCSPIIWLAANFVLVQNADGVYTHTTFDVCQKASHQPLLAFHVFQLMSVACSRRPAGGSLANHQV